MMRRAALALLLCGCAPSGTEPGVLELASRGGYARARIETAVLASYLDVHPGLLVVQRHPSSDPAEYRQRVLESLLIGKPPDAVLLDLGDVPALADRGLLLDLGPYLARVGVTPAEYDSTVLSGFRRGPAIYALPTGYSPLVVAYNKDLFERAGLSSPADTWTWDDFAGVVKQLTRDTDGDGTIDQWGTSIDTRVTHWLPWIWAGGGDVLCADGKRATGCLDAPATIAALRWYTGWSNHHRNGGIARLLDRTVAMITVEQSEIPELRARAAAGGLRLGFAAIPHQVGVPSVTVLHASGYGVPALALRRKLAVELVASLTDSLAGRLRGEAGLELPALSSVATAFAAGDTLGWEGAFLRAASYGRLSWEARVPRWGEVESALTVLMDRIVAGADADVTARDMAQQVDRLLGAPR